MASFVGLSVSESAVLPGLASTSGSTVALSSRMSGEGVVLGKRKRGDEEEKERRVRERIGAIELYVEQFLQNPSAMIGPHCSRAKRQAVNRGIFQKKTIEKTSRFSVLDLFLPRSRTEAIFHVAVKTNDTFESYREKDVKHRRNEAKELRDGYNTLCQEAFMLRTSQGVNVQPFIVGMKIPVRRPVFAMVSPWMQNLLEKVSKESSPLSLPMTLSLIRDVLEGLKGLKDKGVVHGDLKPENILWDQKNKKWTLIDFGTTFFLADRKKYSFVFTTIRYCPWEGLCKRADLFSYSYDMWSLGCIVYELCTGYPLTLEQHLVPIEDSKGVRVAVINEMLQQWAKTLKEPIFEEFLPIGDLKRQLFTRERGELLFAAPAKYVIEKNIEQDMTICLLQRYGNSPFMQTLAKELTSFVLRALKINPQRRITIEEALQLECLREVIIESPIVQKPADRICFFRLLVEKKIAEGVANIHKISFFKESKKEENLLAEIGIEEEGVNLMSVALLWATSYVVFIETICHGERKIFSEPIKNNSGTTLIVNINPQDPENICGKIFDPRHGRF